MDTNMFMKTGQEAALMEDGNEKWHFVLHTTRTQFIYGLHSLQSVKVETLPLHKASFYFNESSIFFS